MVTDLDAFAEELEKFQARVDAMLRSVPAAADELTEELSTLQALSVALEELAVAQDEMREQQDEIARAHEQVEIERARYLDLFDTAPDPYLITDRYGVIRQCNRTAALVLGVEQNELVGKPVLLYFSADERTPIRSRINALDGESGAQEWEQKLQPRGGAPLPAALRVTRHLDGRTGQPELRWSIRDLTDIKQAEATSRERDELEERVRRRTAELAQSNTALKASREELQALARRLTVLQEAERRAVALELHDESGQFLAALALGLGRLEKLIRDNPEAEAILAELKQVTDEVTHELHDLAANLRPASLEKVGLVSATRELLETTGRRASLRTSFQSVGFDDGRLPDVVEMCLYRIVQEGLSNIVRHAQARSAAVTLLHKPDRAVAIVEDDGMGFDPGDAEKSLRLGLVGMRERAAAFGGTLTIETAPGAGTTVYCTVPLPS